MAEGKRYTFCLYFYIDRSTHNQRIVFIGMSYGEIETYRVVIVLYHGMNDLADCTSKIGVILAAGETPHHKSGKRR